MYHRINEFRERGWTEQEIHKTVKIFDKIKKLREENKTALEIAIFWIILIVGMMKV